MDARLQRPRGTAAISATAAAATTPVCPAVGSATSGAITSDTFAEPATLPAAVAASAARLSTVTTVAPTPSAVSARPAYRSSSSGATCVTPSASSASALSYLRADPRKKQSHRIW